MWPGRDLAAYAKSVFSTQFSVTFTFLFSQHSRLLSSKKESKPLNFPSFVCRALFPVRIVGVLRSSETFFGSLAARLTKDWRYRRRQIFQALLPFFFFFACFLIFLYKKAFSERKIALEKFPKKDEGTLQITVLDQ